MIFIAIVFKKSERRIMKAKNKTDKNIERLLTRATIRNLADGRSFERGEDYFLDDAVGYVSEDNGIIKGVVQGTYRYKVKIWVSDGEIDYDCNCPVGQEGSFCKHCVAAALVWLKEKGTSEKSTRKKKLKTSEDDIRAYLMQLGKKDLADMVIERMYDDNTFRERLILKASSADVKGFHADAFKRLIDRAVHVGEFVHYSQMWGYTSNVDQVVAELRKAIDEGNSVEAIEVAEYFIDQVEEAIQYVDDSNGEMGGILSDLQELHHAVCVQAKPDPEELAERLFHKELNAEFDIFYDASATYADVFGKKGTAVYQRLAEEAWQSIPALNPGDKEDWSSQRFHLTRIMECLAKRENDIEKLVAIKSRNLSSAYTFLKIAEIYQKADKHEKALEWAEKGVTAFPERTDSRLRSFLAEEYHKRGRHDEAIELVWKEFIEQPRLEHYQSLCEHSNKNKTWDEWRKKAIQFVECEIQKEKKEHRYYGWYPSDSDLLVRIYMWEKEFEKAWEQANQKGCHKSTWLEIAKQRAKEHPLEAVKVYQSYVGPTIEQGNNSAYEEAVDHLKLIKKWMLTAGEAEAFKRYLAETLEFYKRKRNFVKYANAAKL